MAKKPENRTFNVSVIGLSGTEKEKGQVGVGKSCLCNRFINPDADHYRLDHISVLSQSDFGGRVINNDHFLYWGEVTKTDEGNNFTFHVIEQTEFIDDVSFTPFKTGRTDLYTKRCVLTKVQSAEKLMYICKDQLGMETDPSYEQKVIPDGKLTIDGFLCCFDVSRVSERSIEKQVDFCCALLNNAMKTKKPIVLVTTKNDAVESEYVKEVEKLLLRKEYKNNIPLVETSAHENVNVETAFLLLAHLMDKSKPRAKITPFSDAMKARKEILEVAMEAFKNLLRLQITDSKINWLNARKKLEKQPDYQHYVELFGTDKARVLVRQHTHNLREELIKQKQNNFMKRLPEILNIFLPNLETTGAAANWDVCRTHMIYDKGFGSYFKRVCEDGKSWKDTDLVDAIQISHLPLDILYTTEAETCFRNHINGLQAARRKDELKQEFRALLEKYVDKPGGSLMDYNNLFIGKECFLGLQESERQLVFEDYQRQLKQRLRLEFQELLWERPNVFHNLNLDPKAKLTEDDLNVIYNSLNDDQRFRKFYKLEDDRRVMLLNHVVFLEKPTVDWCFFHSVSGSCKCTECQVSHILKNQRRLVPNGRSLPKDSISSGPIVRPLNLALLGIDNLASELLTEIRNMCIDDEYRVAHRVYGLDYRLIEGDESDHINTLITPNFKPQGCVCIYNSQESLEFICSSTLKMLRSNQSSEAMKILDGLPLVVMLAYEPYTQKELSYLRENGRLLATSLQCEFIDVPAEDLAEKLKFYPEQIEQALHAIIHAPGQAIGNKIMEDTEPDLRLLLCMMCSDPFPMEIPLQPFLNESSFIITCDPETASINSEEDNVFTIDFSIDNSVRKVEVTVTSYHGAHRLIQKGYIYHGYILVYCPKRRASLASLKSLAEAIDAEGGGCMLFLAVPEGGGSRYSLNEHSQGLKDGKDVAKLKSASFMQSNHNFMNQGALKVYDKFLREVWDHREELEYKYYDDPGSPPPYHDDMNNHRCPAPLPTILTDRTESHSNGQSTDAMEEPLYDEPNLQLLQPSHHRTSPIPPPIPSSSPPPVVDSLFPYRSDNLLVKPSMLKTRRDQYAGLAREEYRKSFPAVDSEFSKIRSTMSQSMMEHLNSEAGVSLQQFRKSQSMKLAVKDAVAEPMYDSLVHDVDDPVRWYPNDKTPLLSKFKVNQKPSLQAPSIQPQRLSSAGKGRGVNAPLALPEKIEISEIYGTVKDALALDSDYALVDDALPKSKVIHIKSRKSDICSDSEESECSSSERDKEIFSKVHGTLTQYKKKHNQQKQNDGLQNVARFNIEHKLPRRRRSSDRERLLEHPRDRSHSASEDSTGTTGDEQQTGTTKVNFKKNMKSPESNTHLSDSDMVSSSSQQVLAGMNEDDDVGSTSTDVTIHKVGSEDNDLDLNESGNWNIWFRKKPGKDATRTLEKKCKDEERRRQRENEKKQKELQKLQKKFKKKDNKTAGQSESGTLSLNDFPMSPNNPSVPQFIENCVEFIEAEGLHAEGIYRIPGNKAQVDILTAKYTEDANVNISSLEIQVNAVATVLKAVFSELADPLVPISFYDELIDASGEQDKKVRVMSLRGVFLKMHPLNFEVLKFLITHLNKVSQNCDQNSMDSKNLARCWWPTLFRMEWDTFEEMTEFSRIPEEILQTLIEQCNFFFHSGNEI